MKQTLKYSKSIYTHFSRSCFFTRAYAMTTPVIAFIFNLRMRKLRIRSFLVLWIEKCTITSQ